jgi:hypothetical protein
MLFCPQCGADRRHLAPILPCSSCGNVPADAVPSRLGADPGAGRSHGQQTPFPVLIPVPPPATERASPQSTAGLHIPIAPNPRLIVSGVLLLVLGVWLLAAFLPEHKPFTEGELASVLLRGHLEGSADWRLKSGPYVALNVLAIVSLIGGVVQLVQGLFYRERVLTRCRTCGEEVAARRATWGLRCPLKPHYARIDGVRIAAWIFISAVLLTFLIGFISIVSS